MRDLLVGASLGSFRGLRFTEALELYSRLSDDLGLEAVEIRFEKEEGRPSRWSWEITKDEMAVLSHIKVKGAHLPFIGLNPISPNPGLRNESMRQLKDGLDQAASLGMAYVVMHARGEAAGWPREIQKKSWREAIGELAVYAGERSVLLTVENADSLADLGDLQDLIREVGSEWLKMTFDIGHAHLRRVPPLSSYPVKELSLKVLDVLSPFLVSTGMPYEGFGSIANFQQSVRDLIAVVHVHDYDGWRDHLSLGEGKIDFSFLAGMGGSFRGPYIFELELRNPIPDLRKNYQRFMRALKG